MNWGDHLAIVLLGLSGSGHCVGMCGGFALAVGRGASGAPGLLRRHLAYASGKALTYVFLAVLVAAGFGVPGREGWFGRAQVALALAAGVFMAVYGALQLLEWRPAAWWRRLVEPAAGCGAFAAVARAPGPVAAFATGWLNGFVPCGLVVAVLLHLASFGSVVDAALGAAVFGAATFPGLFAFALVAQGWGVRRRRILVRVMGGLLVVFGAITIVRAFPDGRHWLHEELLPGTSRTIREWCGF